MLRSVLQTVIFIALAITVVIGLFLAWWIAVCAVLCIAGYVSVKRFLAGKGLVQDVGSTGQGPVVLEGQFHVEPEPGFEPRQQGRIIDAEDSRK